MLYHVGPKFNDDGETSPAHERDAFSVRRMNLNVVIDDTLHPQDFSALPGNFGEDIEAIWQRPPRGKIHGVMLILHGCYRSATDFWNHDAEDCETCEGLPEERKIVASAHSRGLIAIAVSAFNVDDRCWAWRDDAGRVDYVVRKILNDVSDTSVPLPLYIMGISSGGTFASRLVSVYAKWSAGKVDGFDFKTDTSMESWTPFGALSRLEGFIVENVALPFDFIGKGKWPPVAFIRMTRDLDTSRQITECVQSLMEHGISTFVRDCDPKKMHPNFFSEQMGLETRASTAIYDAMRQHKLLDRNGYLVSDPVHSNWRDILYDAKTTSSELTNVAVMPLSS